MNFDVEQRTILKVKHGSWAYGTNTSTSDVDIKGVCIEPMTHHLGFLHGFEQYERLNIEYKGQQGVDLTIYSLKKFAKLAADCNPNIIEILHVDWNDVLMINKFGQRLRDARNLFLSKKAKHTFSGYAHSQLKKIKSHRAWLFDPPKAPPTRQEFGLPENTKVTTSELGAFDQLATQGHEIEVSASLMSLITREKAYQAAKAHWVSYQGWLMSRNPARAELERQFGYDTKHGMHLIRLMRMCREILAEGRVYVRRPDAQELLEIRQGSLSYEALVEQATAIEAECDELYKTSKLPHEPDRLALDAMIVDMTINYLRNYS